MHNEEWLREKLAKHLECVLRDAREKIFIGCAQVLMPTTLPSQLAADIMGMADCEPCGIRGCTLYIELEDDSRLPLVETSSTTTTPTTTTTSGGGRGANRHQLGRVIMSHETVPTFEIRLTLRRSPAGWFAASFGLSRLLKNLGRDSLVISDTYCLRKKRLYR